MRTGFTWRNAQKKGFLDADRIDNRFSGDIIGRYKKKKTLTFLGCVTNQNTKIGLSGKTDIYLSLMLEQN